jgi:hypothetical protein
MAKKLPPWVRLAAGFYGNPKVVQLAHRKQHRAIAVYVCGLGWCCEQRTDGFIPEYALAQLHGVPLDAQHLVSVGLWVSEVGGWSVHDWEVWQESNDEKRARSELMRSRANLRHHGHPGGARGNLKRLRGDA